MSTTIFIYCCSFECSCDALIHAAITHSNGKLISCVYYDTLGCRTYVRREIQEIVRNDGSISSSSFACIQGVATSEKSSD